MLTCFKTCPLRRPPCVCSNLLQFCEGSEIDLIRNVLADRIDTYKIEPGFIDSQSLVRFFDMFTKFCVWETKYRFGGWRSASDLLRQPNGADSVENANTPGGGLGWTSRGGQLTTYLTEKV